MGFFKKLFKRKKGGTFFGNLLRKGANVASQGMLGNGDDLANWEAKQAQAQYRALPAPTPIVAQPPRVVSRATATKKADSDNPTFADKAKAFFTKNWMYVVGGVVLLGGAFYMLKGGKRKFSL